MSSQVISACCGVSCATLCWMLFDLIAKDYRIRHRVREVALQRNRSSDRKSSLFRDWNLSEESSRGPIVAIKRYLKQAGLSIEPKHVMAASTASGLLGMVCGVCTLPRWSWMIAAVFSIIPVALIWYTRQRRIEQLRRQIPEAFDVMRRAVESGQTVTSGFQQVAAECRSPLAREFAFCSEQQNLGLPYESALRELARRVPIIELNIFVISMLVQRQSGSSPVEILKNMSDLVRKRSRFQQRIRALTGEGRMQAVVLSVLPIASFVCLLLMRPDYVQPLLDRPSLLAVLGVWQLIGMYWVRQTVQLEY